MQTLIYCDEILFRSCNWYDALEWIDEHEYLSTELIQDACDEWQVLRVEHVIDSNVESR